MTTGKKMGKDKCVGKCTGADKGIGACTKQIRMRTNNNKNQKIYMRYGQAK